MKQNTYRRILLVACLSVVITAIYLLLSGEAWLVSNPMTFWPIPYGNLITWLGLVAWLCLPILWTPRQFANTTLVRFVYCGMFVLAVLWPLIGFLFAGNWAMNFGPVDTFRGSPEAGEYAFGLTAVLALFPLFSAVLLLLFLLGRWLFRYFRVGGK